MSPRMMFSQLIAQERRRWMPFQQALAEEDQEAFDRILEYAKSRLQAAVQLRRPWGFEVVVMAALLESQKRLEEVLRVYPKSSAARKVIQAHAKWSNAS
jgi:hypothetical protein